MSERKSELTLACTHCKASGYFSNGVPEQVNEMPRLSQDVNCATSEDVCVSKHNVGCLVSQRLATAPQLI